MRRKGQLEFVKISNCFIIFHELPPRRWRGGFLCGNGHAPFAMPLKSDRKVLQADVAPLRFA